MKKTVLTIIGALSIYTSAAKADSIHCADTHGQVDIQLTQISGRNYQFSAETSDGSLSGSAIQVAFTTGRTISGKKMSLTISRFPNKKALPSGAQYWATLDILNFQNIDVACENLEE